MYGYLNYKKTKRIDKISRMYKCYYCGLCHALKRHYGMIATLFLSYDLVFASIALSQGESKIDIKPTCCTYKSRRRISSEYDSDYWKHMATVSIALVYSKLLDNYFDNPTILAKISLRAFTLWSRKAQKNNPELFDNLRQSIYSIVDAEHSQEGFAVQSNLTAKMVSEAFCGYEIECDNDTKTFLHTMSEWLCLVDALDDYEHDRKRKKYNPLIMLWKDSKENNIYSYDINSLFTAKYKIVAQIYSDIFFRMKSSLGRMQISGNEKEFLIEMVNRVMPEQVSKLIKRY